MQWYPASFILLLFLLVAPARAAMLEPAGSIALPGRGMALAWSPDGRRIAAGGHFNDPNSSLRYDVRVADVAAQIVTKSFACHYWWVTAVAWHRYPFPGDVIAEGAGDHAVKLWMADAPGSRECKSRGQFRREEGGIEAFYQVNGWTTSLAFSPDGRFLASTSRDRAVRLWDLAPGPNQWKVVRVWYDAKAGNLLSVRWTPDGRRLAIGDRSGKVTVWDFDPDRDLWDDKTMAEYAALPYEKQPGWFTRNAARLAIAPRWQEGGHKQVWNVRFSPDGTRLAAGGGDGTLSIWDAATGTLLARATTPKKTPIHGLDWSPDGALIAAGAKDKKIYLYDPSWAQLVDTITGHADLVTAVAWSPDGTLLASTAGGQLVQDSINQLVQGPDMAIRLWRRTP
jgi:WD40 repeat protein